MNYADREFSAGKSVISKLNLAYLIRTTRYVFELIDLLVVHFLMYVYVKHACVCVFIGRMN